MFLLMTAIKGINFQFDGQNNPLHALNNITREFYCYYHMVQTKNPKYLETFKNKVSVIDYYCRAIETGPLLPKE